MQIITDISQIDKQQWADFVLEHPQGNVFQTPAMYAMYEHTKNMQPLVYIGVQEGEIVACLLAVVQYEGEGIKKVFTARSIIIGGPIVKGDDESLLTEILQAYIQDMKRQPAIYSQIRNIYSRSVWDKALRKIEFAHDDHLNIFLDVQPGEEILHNNLHKERKRNIRQGREAGLLYKEVESDEEIKQISALINQTYKRVRVPLAYDNLFSVALEHLGKDVVKFFAAYNTEGKMIAGQVRLCYKELVYAWYAGSNEAYFKSRPNDFLIWNVIVWSHNHGYKVFDFGGGGRPGVPYGVRDYKLKYGAQMENYGRYEYIHKPLLMLIGKWGYRLYRIIKR